MKLSLYDWDLNRIAIIGEQYISCLWSEGYNTVEPFSVELLATEEYKRKVKPDCYLGRDDRKTLMVIKSVQTENGHIVASGKQASRCLADVACETTIPAGANVAATIKAAYDASYGYHNIAFAPPTLDVTYDHQISDKDCLELCTTMCQDTDTGFRVVRSGSAATVEFYRPAASQNQVLSERYGNLLFSKILLSTEQEKNYAVVMGEGEGEARARVRVDTSGGGQKRGIIVDARDVTREDGESDVAYNARLAARGYEKLLECRRTWEVAFQPISQTFGTRYDLGNVLTVLLPDYSLRLQARVVRFTDRSQGNTTETTVEVGSITILR